jgi:2-polyprenyl-3-methyl-5-hydroxy-6-metoxy-1,4-benzoquinol methylase
MLYNIDLKWFNLKKGAKVLDVGSALGINSIGLDEVGFDVTALEIDPNLVKQFKKNEATKHIPIQLGDATKMPFKNASFDGAVLIEVIEHVPDTETLLSEINRVLTANGQLCIGVPTGYTDRVYTAMHKDYPANTTHVHIFNRDTLKNKIEQAGFRIKKIQTKNFPPAVSWFFHAALKSKSDHTGKIHNHLWIDRILDPFFATWSKIPVLKRGLSFTERHFGKSWYIYCEKVA